METAQPNTTPFTVTALRAAVLVLLVAATWAAAAGPARAGKLTGAKPCPDQSYYGWFGDSEATKTTVPDPDDPEGGFAGVVVRPTNTARFPGPRPVVVFQHGWNGDLCSGMWIARYLAGEGFVTEVHTAPPGNDPVEAFNRALRATRAAISFLRSPANPYAGVTDGSRLGLAGHSLGASVVTQLQGDPALAVKTIAALDGLRPTIDPDVECGAPAGPAAAPLVPALGLANDEICPGPPGSDPRYLKLGGYGRWRTAGLPAMSLVLRGFVRGDFTISGGNQKNRLTANYLGAWMKRWLLPDPDQDATLLRRNLLSRPAEDWLSPGYASGAHLPGAVDTYDFAGWLAADPIPPRPPVAPKPRAWLRLKAPSRTRPGRRIATGAFLRNTGRVDLVRAKLCVRPSARLAHHPGCRFVDLARGRGRLAFVPVRVRRKVGGRLVLRASLWYRGRVLARDWTRVAVLRR